MDLTQWKYDPCRVGPPKAEESWWRVLTLHGPWSPGEGNSKPLKHSCLENPMNSMKRQKDMNWKMNSPGWYVPNMLLEKSREIAAKGMKRLSQSRSNTQLWMFLVVKVKSDAVKKILHRNNGPRMLGLCIKVNWKWSNRKWQEWTLTF